MVVYIMYGKILQCRQTMLYNKNGLSNDRLNETYTLDMIDLGPFLSKFFYPKFLIA